MVVTRPKELHILSWNIASVNNKTDQLVTLLDEVKPDVVLLQETWLKPHLPQPLTPGYTWFRRDRVAGRGGGVAILVANHLDYLPELGPELKAAELTGGKINTASGPLYVGSLYLPPSKGRKRELGQILRSHPHFFIGGDLNAHWEAWGSTRSNDTGAYLSHWVNDLELNIHIPPGPTRVHPRRPQKDAVLDYGLTNSSLEQVEVSVHPIVDSDHRPVSFHLRSIVLRVPRHFKLKTNWEGIANDLAHVEWPDSIPLTEQGVNDASLILQAELQAAKLNNSQAIEIRDAKSKLIPRRVRILQQEKRTLSREFTLTRDPATKTTINQINRRISAELREWEEDARLEQLKSIDDPDTRWQALKKSSNKPSKITTLFKPDNTPAYSNADKAELIATSLADRFTEFPSSCSNPAESFTHTATRSATGIPSLTEEETLRAIFNTKEGTSPGHDDVEYKMLKLLPAEGITYVTKLFNAIVQTQCFPTTWKRAVVIPLPKEGKDPHQPGNYRPISLLPCLSKVFEKCLLPHILAIERSKHTIPDHQMGFRKKHSTTHQLVRTTEHLVKAWNGKKATFMVTLDIEAAFDRVPHNYLLYKLAQWRYPPWFLNFTQSYFSQRTFCVKVHDAVSRDFPIKAGTPQGSILSPLFYSLYISDMPQPKPEDGIICQYADDTCYIISATTAVEAEEKMQMLLVLLERWCSRWKTKINGSKSTVMYLNSRAPFQRPYQVDIMVSGEKVPVVSQCKYLGIIFDDRLLWKKHIDYTLQKAKQASAILSKNIPGHGKLSSSTLTTLYQAFIRSILTYGAPAWLGASVTHVNKLHAFERSWLRRIYKKPWFTKQENVKRAATFPLLPEFLYTTATNFYTNSQGSQNPLISSLGRFRRRVEGPGKQMNAYHRFLPYEAPLQGWRAAGIQWT